MSKLYLTPILVVWLAVTAQAQLTNTGTIVNRGNLISDWQMPYVITAGGSYTGINGGFEHRGPAARTLVNDGTYATSGNHTDKFTGPGGQPGAQEIAGTKRPQFQNVLFANGASSSLNITNPAGISVARSLTFANGVTTTVRSLTSAGALVFTDTATYTGGNTDAQHVNGYVSKLGRIGFSFPVGSGTDVRSLTISVPATATATATDHYSVAWMAGDPTTTTDPSNASATHPITNRQAGLSAVSPAGQWDWIAVSGTGAGLIITVSLPNLTDFATASALRLVGWNGSQWITLSTGAKPYLNGASYASGNAEDATLQGTMVAGITAIGIGSSSSASLSGRVLNDGNGLTDNLVNQIGNGPNPLNGADIDPQAAGRQALYVSLVSNGASLTTVAVSSTGTYRFNNLAAGAYSVVLGTDSAGRTSALLPTDWAPTGEQLGTGPGSDGTPDGILTGIVVQTDSVANANLGVNRRPQVTPVTVAARPNPGGTVQVPVSVTAFTGSDLEDGSYPNNLTDRPLVLTPATGGTLYYNAVAVSAALTVDRFDPTKVSIDPTAPGATTATFGYSVKDKAGVESRPNLITVPFGATFSLAGRVFNDGNGLTDNLVNQTGQGPNPLNGEDIDPQIAGSQSIYATLYNANGAAVDQKPVTSDGTFSFTGLVSGLYRVVLSAFQAIIPRSVDGLGSYRLAAGLAPGDSASLPAGWAPTGEQLGSGPGSDGQPNGILAVQIEASNITGANFGIAKRPRGQDATVAAQPNPGGTNPAPVAVSAFTGTDLEDGTYPNFLAGRTVRLTPAVGGTLYHAGTAVNAPSDIASFDPTKVTVDPTAPAATTVSFTYSFADNAGVFSDPARITLTFTAPTFGIAGNVFNDGNGLNDNLVNPVGRGPNPLNGEDIDPEVAGFQPIYAILFDNPELPQVLIAQAVSSSGTYSFTGLQPGTYSVQLSTRPSLYPQLWPDWVSTGEHVGRGPGNDGPPDGKLADIQITNVNIEEANFGLNKLPRGAGITLAAQPNPGDDQRVAVPASAFTGTDLEDGTYPNNLAGRRVKIVVSTGGTAYYKGQPISQAQEIEVDSFEPTQLAVDPAGEEDATVNISYQFFDNAFGNFLAFGSSWTDIKLPFTSRPTFSLSGRVFDDGNGLNDNLVNQTGQGPKPLAGSDIDPQVAGAQAIYAVLLNEYRTVQSVTAVSESGTYAFRGLPAGTYRVALSTDPTGQTWPSLPAGWSHTGEQPGGGPGNDGLPDGILAVQISTSNVEEANFGLNKRPQGQAAGLAAQVNPGGSAQVPVPATAFVGTDLEDGTYPNNLAGRAVLLSPATGGTLTYNGGPVTTPLTIDRFDPGRLTVDPTGEDETTVVFTYSVRDNAGVAAEPVEVRLPFTARPTFSLSGRVFNDGNGLNDNLVNQVGRGPNPLNGADIDPQVDGAQPVYVILYDNLEFPQVLRTTVVSDSGTYAFANLRPGQYFVLLNGRPALSPSGGTLPTGWLVTGVQTGNGPEPFYDYTPIEITNANLEGLNFGLNKVPQVTSYEQSPLPNPGPNVRVQVDEGLIIKGADLEDGDYNYNFGGRSIELFAAEGGQAYYDGELIPEWGSVLVRSFDPRKLEVSVDSSGKVDVIIRYAVADLAHIPGQFESMGKGHIKVSFRQYQPYTLSGHVFDDANGQNDNTVNGVPLDGTAVAPISGRSRALYVTLVSNGKTLSTVPVTSTGTYRFTDVPYHPTNKVILSTSSLGSSRGALPDDWVNTGEHVGTGPGIDGVPDGILGDFVVEGDSVSNANFGVNRRPQVFPDTVAAQPNPGGAVQVPVPASAFNGTDLEDGTYADNLTRRRVTLTAATGGSLYYNGNLITASYLASNFDPTKVSVAPTAAGSTTVRFTYSVEDRASVPARPAIITLPFTAPAVTLSGKVFNDANGLTDNLVNQYNGYEIVGPRFAPNQSLYATLVNAGNQAIATVPVAPRNTYSFTAVNPGTYSVVLGMNPGGSTSSSLPIVWANTGEHLGTGPGSDGQPDGILTGIVVGSDAVNEANFGVDRIPTAYDKSVAAQSNPKGTGQASLFPDPFGGDDTEDGNYYNLLGRAVLLKPATGGTLYYDGTPVVTETEIASFRPSKVRIDPTASGQTVATFAYAVRDDAGVASNSASVTVPFYNNEDDDTNDDGNQNNPANQVQLPNNTFSTVIPTVLIPPVAPLIAGVLIPAFPPGIVVLTVNGTTYTPDTFPPGGVIVATDPNGVTTGTVSAQPINPAVAVAIPFVAIGVTGVAVTIVATTNTTPATLTNNGPLSCTATTVTLTATGDGTYRFSAGATPVNGSNTATVSLAGTYSVTVVGANGYRATASTTVTEDKGLPTATLTNNGPLSCSATSVTLTAAGGTAYRFGNGAAQINNGSTATVRDAGVYSVTVTASNGCTATVQTTVASQIDSLGFVSQPASASTVPAGTTVTTSVLVTGTGPVTYQWYKNSVGNPVVSQTSATLSLSAAQPSDAGRYFVVVTGTCTSLTSTAFELTVRADSLVATFVAKPTTLLTSDTTTLSVSISGGNGPYRYQFAGPGTLTPGASSSTVSVSGLPAGVQTFTVVVSDASQPASLSTSATVSVTVNPANTAPVATTNVTQVATVGVPFTYVVNAFIDAETPNSLTYTARISPANGLQFDALTRVISGIPDSTGALRVVVTATDPGSLSASTSFTIVVGPPTSTTGVVISQIYGGGGDSGAAYKHDFVELFNRGKDTVSLTGWSIQFARTTATTWQSTTLTGSIPPGGYYLVQGAAGSSTVVTTNLPTPDAVGTINVDDTTGTVALVKTSSALSGTCPTGSTIVDFVGYGSAARCYEGSGAAAGLLTPTLAFLRKRDGCTDTDDNQADFTIGRVVPRNAASPINDCNALVVQLTASPKTLFTSDTATLSVSVSGGSAPYQYQFAGPGTLTPGASSSTVSVSALSAGVQTFTVVVSDATSPASLTASATVSVTVSPANTAPTVVRAVGSQTATVGQSYSLSVAGVFTDAETPTALSLTAGGLPAGLVLSGTTLGGTPRASGVSSVTLTATDGGGLSASTRFSLTVQPAPVVVPPLSVTLTASSSSLLTTDRIDLSATASGGTVPYGYTFSGPGSFSLISLNTMSVSGLAAGVHTFTVVVNDATLPTSLTATATVSVTVSPANTAPVAITNATQVATVGSAFSYTVNAFTDDQPASQLNYLARIVPVNGLSFDPATRTLSGTPSATGVSSVTVTAIDRGNLSASTTFDVVVNRAPVVAVASLSGTVFDDGNGLTDNTVNGAPLNATAVTPIAGTTQALYVSLVSNGASLTTVAVSSTGTYRFNNLAAGAYSVVLGADSAGRTSALLPTDWAPTGEQLGTGVGSDGTPDGILRGIVVQTDSVTNANFGVNRRPQTTSRTLTVQAILNTSVPVPVTAFSGSDLEDGVYANNLTGRPVTIMPATGGKLYYWDSPVDPVLPTARFDPTKLTLIVSDPKATTVAFTYSVKDNAGVSSEVDTITLVLSSPVVVSPLSVSLAASPPTLLTDGTTSLSAQVAGGSAPYQYQFAGPGTLTPGASSSTVSVSALSAGVQTFTVVVSDATSPASLTASATVSVTVSPANTAPTVVRAVGSQTATVGQSYSLSVAGVFTDAETPTALSLTAGGLPAGLVLSGTTLGGTPRASGVSSVTLTATDGGGLSASTRFSLTVQPAPVVVPPLSVTLTAKPTTLLTTDTTRLSAVVAGGEAPYSYTFSGPGTLVATGNLASVSSLSAGVQTFKVLVTDAASQTATAIASVTVTGPAATTALRVLYSDADGKQTNNYVKPNLQVANVGTSPIPYGQLTLRYWLTVENFAPLTNLSVYYAPLGSDKVKMKYVELNQPRQGALGYVEYSFDPSVGLLVAGGNSGTIQTGIAKQDYSNFNEADDYSFVATGGLTTNARITAYLNGALIWGEEPPVVAVQQRLKAYTQSRNSGANTISTSLQIRNEGNVGADYSEVKVRYYLTAEGSQSLNFFLDYAVLGNDNVKGQFVRINPPLVNADTYLELSFSAGLGKLNPGGSTGDIQYRIAKTDWSDFNQTNDYSYLTGNNLAENGRVVIYVAGKRVWGEEPSGTGGRAGAEARSEVPLQVTVLGNPVTGDEVRVEVRGAQDQPLRLRLMDEKGSLVSEHAVESAGSVERPTLNIGRQPAGVLLLRVSTPTQAQTVKVIKH